MARDPEQFRVAETALWKSVGLDPTETWIRMTSGENVRVQVIGEGPPILFIHGGSASGANWAPVLPHIEGFRCLVVDRPGCGLSDPVARGAKVADIAHVKRFADRFVMEMLNGLNVERAHLVSTSFGGYFALRSAAAHPERVERIVEMTFPIGAPVDHAPVTMRISTIPGLGAALARVPPTRFAVRSIMKQLGMGRALADGRITDELIEWFLALLGHTDTLANELRANPKIITPIRGINRQMLLSDELLGRIAAPTLFLWGGEDPMGGEESARRFAARFEDARVEMLPLAGHAPWIDDPERCAGLMGEFLGT